MREIKYGKKSVRLTEKGWRNLKARFNVNRIKKVVSRTEGEDFYRITGECYFCVHYSCGIDCPFIILGNECHSGCGVLLVNHFGRYLRKIEFTDEGIIWDVSDDQYIRPLMESAFKKIKALRRVK